MREKYIHLAETLRQTIPHMKNDSINKLPSETALASRYGVSRETVRKAIAALASEGLVETRRGSGTYLSRLPHGDSRQIAILAACQSDYMLPVLLHQMQAVFEEHGYHAVVHITDNSVQKERDVLAALLETPVAGILADGCRTALPNPNIDLYAQLQNRQTPVLFLHGAYAALKEAICVGDDNYGGAYQLTKYLLDKGHRQIAGIYKSDDVRGVERYYGCVCALRDADSLLPDQRFLWYTTEDRTALVEQRSPALLHRFLSAYLGTASAVICYNDEIAYYLIKSLLAAKRRVPQDVAVVSFDNSYYSTLGDIGITSLGHVPCTVARRAAESLIALIHGTPVRSAALPWQLFARASSEGAS